MAGAADGGTTGRLGTGTAAVAREVDFVTEPVVETERSGCGDFASQNRRRAEKRRATKKRNFMIGEK